MTAKAIKVLLSFTFLCGVVYPLLVTLIATFIFPYSSQGSLLKKGDKVVGSELIGQKFTSEKYFWGRPSANDYDPLKSGGTNLSWTSEKLKEEVEKRVLAFKGVEFESDMLFSSGSGLDPHILKKSAYAQIPRVLKARGVNDRNKLEALIEEASKGRLVNVLKLNLLIDERL